MKVLDNKEIFVSRDEIKDLIVAYLDGKGYKVTEDCIDFVVDVDFSTSDDEIQLVHDLDGCLIHCNNNRNEKVVINGKEFSSLEEASSFFGVSEDTISKIVSLSPEQVEEKSLARKQEVDDIKVLGCVGEDVFICLCGDEIAFFKKEDLDRLKG